MQSKEFEEEYEILKSIYTEIEISPENTLDNEAIASIVLYPSTCDDDETRYVTLCLEFNIPLTYPKTPPKILFKNPRGLSETKLEELHQNLRQKCSEDWRDTPMLFQIIDLVQEFLTSNNLPASDCPICLNTFHKSDVFYRSKCFHYFHSQCLGKFLQNILRNAGLSSGGPDSKSAPEFLCPVCREEIDQSQVDIEKLLDSPPPYGETDEDGLHHGTVDTVGSSDSGTAKSNAKISAEWLEQRETMKLLYEKQERQGGIIDLSQKAKKMLIISSPTPAQVPVVGESATVDASSGSTPSDSITTSPSSVLGITSSMANEITQGANCTRNSSVDRSMGGGSGGTDKKSSTGTTEGPKLNKNSSLPSARFGGPNANIRVTSGHYHHHQHRPHHRYGHHLHQNGQDGEHGNGNNRPMRARNPQHTASSASSANQRGQGHVPSKRLESDSRSSDNSKASDIPSASGLTNNTVGPTTEPKNVITNGVEKIDKKSQNGSSGENVVPNRAPYTHRPHFRHHHQHQTNSDVKSGSSSEKDHEFLRPVNSISKKGPKVVEPSEAVSVPTDSHRPNPTTKTVSTASEVHEHEPGPNDEHVHGRIRNNTRHHHYHPRGNHHYNHHHRGTNSRKHDQYYNKSLADQ